MEPKKRSIPMTDGTPVACRQKNAQEFLAGHVPGVMAQYGLGLFGPAQQQHSRQFDHHAQVIDRVKFHTRFGLRR